MSQLFLEAVMEGRLPTAKALHRQGTSVNTKNKHGYPALYIAMCIKDNIARSSMVCWLLHAGADTGYIDPYTGRNLLATAAYFNCTAEIHMLLEHEQVDISARDKKGRTALHYAVFYNNVASVLTMAKYAKENQIKVDMSDQKGWTPCSIAVIQGFTRILRILVKFGQAETVQDIAASMDKTRLVHDYTGCQTMRCKILKTSTLQSQRPRSAPVYFSSKQPMHKRPSSDVTLKSSHNKQQVTSNTAQKLLSSDSSPGYLTELLRLKSLQLSDNYCDRAICPVAHSSTGIISFSMAVNITKLAARARKRRVKSTSGKTDTQTMNRSESKNSLSGRSDTKTMVRSESKTILSGGKVMVRSETRPRLNRQTSRPVLRRTQSMLTIKC